MGKEMSASGQANHNAALNMIFDYAIERGYMLRTQRPVLKNTGSTGARRPDFSEKEIDRMFDHMLSWAKGGKAGRPQQIRELLMIYVCFAATTGMRPGTEMDNIEWRQIDVVETDAEPRGSLSFCCAGGEGSGELPTPILRWSAPKNFYCTGTGHPAGVSGL
jgi:hypothetical protein